LAFAERYELADLLPDGDRVVAALEAEHAILRAALDWLAAGDPGPFTRLAAALGLFWSNQGHYQEGQTWLERALAHEGAAVATDRAKALVLLGLIEGYQGANTAAEAHLSAGLAVCREQGLAHHTSLALLLLGGLAVVEGDHGRGVVLLEEALTASHAMADHRLAGIRAGYVLVNLAMVPRARGDHALAAEHLETALDRMRAAGHTPGMILILGDLGDLARDRGEHARALGQYREALALGQGNPGLREVTDAVEAVGVVAVVLGQAARGARLLAAAAARRERTGLRFRVAENQEALEQAVAAGRAALGDAAFATAWAAGRTLRPEQAVAEALSVAGTPLPPPSLGLTPRETEILRLLAGGQTDPTIAEALFISVRTVETHVAHILAKLGVHTRTAAVAAAIGAGLVAPGSPTPSGPEAT
jgi:non-specific serine/threonine protein kinase